ncbi:MAG: hypothetical protein B6I20_12755 [Bacteroidetes bacterium 4572_117]|nr:MAG: hypothetical protein B6I20_12755 [Bacteroidetes bacterium 4572_117]
MKFILITICLFALSISSQAQVIKSGDCMQGQGTFVYPSGAVYSGEWEQGKRSGKGKMTYPKRINESNIGKGPIVLNIYHSGTKKQVQEKLSEYNDESLIAFEREFDDDNYFKNLAEKVGAAYKHDVTTAKGYYLTGLKQINLSSNLSDEAKLIMRNRHKRNYLKQMLNPNNEEALNSIRDYANAIRKKTDAEKFQAEADNINLLAYQKLTNDILASIPFVDQAMNFTSMVTGEDLSGGKISDSKRYFDYMMLIAPSSLKKLISDSRLNKALETFTKKASKLTLKQANKLIQKCGISAKQLDKVYKKLSAIYTKYPKTTQWIGKTIKSIPENQIKGAGFKKIDKTINEKKE